MMIQPPDMEESIVIPSLEVPTEKADPPNLPTQEVSSSSPPTDTKNPPNPSTLASPNLPDLPDQPTEEADTENVVVTNSVSTHPLAEPEAEEITTGRKKRKMKGKSKATTTHKVRTNNPQLKAKDNKRIKHIRKDQKRMKQQLNDIELKLELFESRVDNVAPSPPASREAPCYRTPPASKEASSQTDANNTSEATPQTTPKMNNPNPDADVIDELRSVVSKLEATCETQASSLNGYKTDRIALRNEVTELTTQLQERNTQLDIAQHQITELTSSKQSLTTDLRAAQQRITELAPKQQQLQSAITECDRLRELTSEYERQLRSLRSDIESQTKQNNDLLQQLSTSLEQQRTTRKPSRQQQNDLNRNDGHEPETDAVVAKPDVLFFHDSLGKKINNTIMKNEKLVTEKSLTYKLDDIQQDLNGRASIPHRAIVIHCGTNNLNVEGQTPDTIVKKMDQLVQSIHRKAPDAHVIISSIVTRKDSEKKQRQLDYINAAIGLKYADNRHVSTVSNNNVDEGCLGTDLIHLGKKGTSRLAVNIKKAVAKALGIPVATRLKT